MSDRLVFPDGFLWGAATSAYQIEGAIDEDGKTPSVWDTYSHLPGTTCHGDDGDLACDHYHRVEADVSLMAQLGLRGYRFSIAWPRVQPNGEGAANPAGLDHYRRLIDLLRANDIEPLVTLYHWDLPQRLQDRGGWTNRETAKRFEDYAGIVGNALGDRVQLWVTINEPWVEAFLGYGDRLHAPGLGEIGAGVLAAHHLLLGHGMALRAIAGTARSSPQIGIALDPAPVTAASDNLEDIAAAKRVDEQRNRWFLDPLFRGSYPNDLLAEYVGLVGDQFVHAGDFDVIGADLGFLALNYYSPVRVAAAPLAAAPTRRTPFTSWLGVKERPPTGRGGDYQGLDNRTRRPHRYPAQRQAGLRRSADVHNRERRRLLRLRRSDRDRVGHRAR